MTPSFIFYMDIIGTIAFAISGVMVAVRKDMDAFGINILALVTATGGGVIRDLLIGEIPPVMFRNPLYFNGKFGSGNEGISRKFHTMVQDYFGGV